eukprot:751413-Prymnesium_polylepis.1
MTSAPTAKRSRPTRAQKRRTFRCARPSMSLKPLPPRCDAQRAAKGEKHFETLDLWRLHWFN